MSFTNPRRRSPMTRSARDGECGSTLITTMALRKSATFHCPTSPASSTPNGVFVPPQLPRSQTHLDDVVDASRRRIALTLNEIDEAFANSLSLDSSPAFCKKQPLRDSSSAVPQGFLDLGVVDPAMAKPVPRRRDSRPNPALQSKGASDSGLGSSIASSEEKRYEAIQTKKKIKDKKTNAAHSALTGASSAKQMVPAMSRRAFARIHEHTLRPLREKPSLKDFETIVLDVPRRIQSKDIICLRDLEKTLIFMAPKSAKSADLYLDFCLSSIRCIQATVEYLPERDQVRSTDRPYTNGYFIDLKEQIYEYGRQLAAAKDKNSAVDHTDINRYAPRFVPYQWTFCLTNDHSRDDEIRLHGGIAENGRPAELIRVRKDGSAVSIVTGKPVDLDENPAVQFKRSISEQREDEEEIMRSMARRRKNATPEELAPKKCREPGCNKQFRRPCDLTKHEKTHSRPWKCTIPTCKYHKIGWPTEKERDRHQNDRHSDAPATYRCPDCSHTSKRESNLKQHMEKSHGYDYVRTKTNRKKVVSTPSQFLPQQQQTPPLGSLSPPNSTPSYSVPTPPQCQDGGIVFTNYQADGDWSVACGTGLGAMNSDLEHTSPSAANPYEQYSPYQNGSTFVFSSDEELYAAPMLLSTQLPAHDPIYHDRLVPLQLSGYENAVACSYFPPKVPTHFSPGGQENAMLYTPSSLREVDEGFGEAFAGDGPDFQLFAAGHHIKGNAHLQQQSMFGDVPSADLGFSQTSQPDIFQQAWLEPEGPPFM
ncbi:copper-binding transcription factor [Claviceps citrina]|nr:copper-binding transcription factor [Claviceps citrina]